MGDDKITLESRGKLQDFISEQAANNPAYRDALVADPKKVLEGHLGGEFPEGFNVKVVEETPDTMYVIAPHVPGELSDDDLEQVAGGFLGGIIGGIGDAVGGLFGGGGSGGGGGGGGGDTCERNYGSFNSQITISGSVGDVDGSRAG